MADPKRVNRLNSLLKKIISDVILKEVKNPHLSRLFTVTKVDVAKDLRQAKVYVSVIGEKKIKDETLTILKSASGFISVCASKQVVLRYFPKLSFFLDESLDAQMHVEELVSKIQSERETREPEINNDEREI